MLFSQILGKNIISLQTAQIIGAVKCAYIENDTYEIKYIGVSNGNILALEHMCGNSDNITIVSENVLEKNDICAGLHCYSNGVTVIDIDGANLGASSDLNINASKRERVFTIGEKRYSLKSIVATSSAIIIVNPSYKKISGASENISLATSEAQFPKETAVVSEAPEAASAIPTETVQVVSLSAHAAETVVSNAPLTYSSAQIPARQTNDYSFLLGKTVKKEVSDLSRVFVIQKGTVISDKVITDAKRAGKLMQLAISI